MKKVTITMVAERSGFSRGTVDRVLHNRPNVTTEARDKIIQTMKELGFQPPTLKQAIDLGLEDAPSPKASRKLGILLPHWVDSVDNDLMKGINDARDRLSECNCSLVVTRTETTIPGEILEKIRFLEDQDVDGISLWASGHSSISEKIQELTAKGLPVVTFNTDVQNSNRLAFVGQDIYGGGRLAGCLMSKMVQPGQKIVIGVADDQYDAHVIRLNGFCDYLRSVGFTDDDFIIRNTHNDYLFTYQTLSEVLQTSEAIAAIYMANHSLSGCAEAIKTLHRQGQYKIISHDLTASSRFLLSNNEIDFVISQDFYRQGYAPSMILYHYLETGELMDTEVPELKIYCSENITCPSPDPMAY